MARDETLFARAIFGAAAATSVIAAAGIALASFRPMEFFGLLGPSFIFYTIYGWTLGLAGHARLMQRVRVGVRAYWIGGGVSLLLISFVFGFLYACGFTGSWSTGLQTGLGLSLIGALGGALMGWFFWLIRRPDRDANPPTTAT